MSDQASSPHRSELPAIDQVREAHVASLNAGDVDAFASIFSEDGVQMPPNFPANTGRAAIRAWGEAFLGPLQVEFGLEVAEVRVAGDWAFERGKYRIRATPKAGGEGLADVGKYITIYQKQPGSGWLLARDIWNSDNPMPGMG